MNGSLISDIHEVLGEANYSTPDGKPISALAHGFPYQEEKQGDCTKIMDFFAMWQPKDVHLGLGGFYNLDIAATGVPYVITFDINSNQKNFWQVAKEIILKSADSDDCIERMIAAKSRLDCRVNPKSSFKSDIYAEKTRPGSWLRPENFPKIRKLFEEERFQHISLDILDTERCQKLREYLDERKVNVNSIYLSNVPLLLTGSEGFYGEKWEFDPIKRLIKNLQALCNIMETLFVVSGAYGGVGTFHYDTYDPVSVRPGELLDILRKAQKDRKSDNIGSTLRC